MELRRCTLPPSGIVLVVVAPALKRALLTVDRRFNEVETGGVH